MKKMKKLLSILLALVMALSLVACSSKAKEEDVEGKEKTEATDKEKVKDDKTAATEVANAFMNAMVSMDFKTLVNYVTNEEDIPEELMEDPLAAVKEMVFSDMPAEFSNYADDFEGFMNDFYNKVLGKMSYEIKEVNKDDDAYIATVEITTPVMDSVSFEDLFDEDAELAAEEVVMELYESGKITDDMTEEEVMDVFMPELINILRDIIADTEFETETVEEEIVVVKDGKNWLVDVTESGMDFSY